MKKEESVERYGIGGYEKHKKQTQRWFEKHPEKRREYDHKHCRVGGRYYFKSLDYNNTGLRNKRKRIRMAHAHVYRRYKRVIAPESQLHHQWQPGSADYDGVALVEKDQHMHGFVDVLLILEGVITLATEREIRER